MVLTDDEVAYMGDDIVDLAVLGRVGLAAAPADATAEVLARVDFVSTHRGGEGAVRDLIEVILRAQGLWESIVAVYNAEGLPRKSGEP
jgi:3-deoxy-D-manno-octulosonate 8-phosphate phosphatase (KDO 8-P phosphatase)